MDPWPSGFWLYKRKGFFFYWAGLKREKITLHEFSVNTPSRRRCEGCNASPRLGERVQQEGGLPLPELRQG